MNVLSYLLFCIPVLLQAKPDTAYNGIKFEQTSDWEQIKAKAKASNKYIFLDCYATWCAPCKMMDKEVYSRLEVGAALNNQFISVKIQMDSTSTDNELTKKWYKTAQKMRQEFKIVGFPTYLFFTPDGQLVYRDMGFKDAENFIHLTQLAKDSRNALYYSQYLKYKKNTKVYKTLGKLTVFTRDIINDRALSDTMAKDYKENYLDKLDTAVLYTKEHIDFICSYINLIHSQDKFFALCYNQPDRFDSIIRYPGIANDIVTNIIFNEELAPKVAENGEPLSRLPDWKQIENDISKKYSLIDAKKIVLSYKTKYYRDIYKDWTLWAKYKDEMIRLYPPKPPYGLNVFTEINGHGGAWHAFLHCPDTTVLTKALEWVDIAMALDHGNTKYVRAAYMDTKANLLYKIGRKEEALALQKEAIESILGVKNSELLENYAKMQRGDPTWDISQ